MADDVDERVARRAHAIWEREGRPEGRALDHWTLAKEEVAIEDNYRDTLRPDPVRGPDDTALRTEPVEPVLSVASQGDVPGLTDQGEESLIPGDGGRTPAPAPGPAGTDAGAAAPERRAKRRRAGG